MASAAISDGALRAPTAEVEARKEDAEKEEEEEKEALDLSRACWYPFLCSASFTVKYLWFRLYGEMGGKGGGEERKK